MFRNQSWTSTIYRCARPGVIDERARRILKMRACGIAKAGAKPWRSRRSPRVLASRRRRKRNRHPYLGSIAGAGAAKSATGMLIAELHSRRAVAANKNVTKSIRRRRTLGLVKRSANWRKAGEIQRANGGADRRVRNWQESDLNRTLPRRMRLSKRRARDSQLQRLELSRVVEAKQNNEVSVFRWRGCRRTS